MCLAFVSGGANLLITLGPALVSAHIRPAQETACERMSERTTLTANALASGRHWRQTDPSSSSGGVVGVERELDELFVPEGHISGSPLSETSTFLNTDLASIGMFGATYTGVRALMRAGGQGMRMI